MSESFVDQLRLDERDLAECARLIDQRDRSQSGQRQTQLQRELVDARARLQRALEQGVRQENTDLAEELFAHAREAKMLITAREAELAALDASKPVSTRAWLLAQRIDWIAQRIRATFTDWSREAKARVFGIALDDALLGYVNRWELGLWMQWQGGGQSRREIRMSLGKWQPWSTEKKTALARYYPLLTWDALCKTFPRRSQSGIGTYARILGVQRGTGPFTGMVPVIFEEGTPMNTMSDFGFPLPRMAERECDLSVSASRQPMNIIHA